ncbi:hypothetical protein ACP4OV_027913 [Aristida adscensionis]
MAAATSTLTNQASLRALCDKHGVPREYTPLCAGGLGLGPCETPPEGLRAISVYAAALEAGQRFPLHEFYCKVLRHYRLAPSQLAPNAWAYMAAFVLLCERAGVEPLLSVFRSFFSIHAHRERATGAPLGWHHFQQCADGKAPNLFTGVLSTRGGGKWKDRFFFLQPPPGTPWRCPEKWGKPRRADVRRQEATGTEVQKLLKMVMAHSFPIKSFLSQHHSCLPVGAPMVPPAPLKHEFCAPPRKRRTPPPAQQSFTPGQSSAPPRNRPAPAPAQQSFTPGQPGGHGNGSRQPFGMQALQVGELMMPFGAAWSKPKAS